MDLGQPGTILITCARGLAEILRAEVEALGYRVIESHDTGLTIRGNLHDAMRLNLHLRTAFNVLYLLKQFDCRSPDRLYNRAHSVAWESLITPDSYVSVFSKVETASVNNTMFANVRVKDAIVDRMTERFGRRPDSGSERVGVVVHLYWKRHRAWLYLNTTGQKLADRSYRRLPHHAPMQETLAAGVMLATGYDGSQPLVCPMCGSGTLAIEAALIATGRAPGLLRSKYSFMHLTQFDDDAWQALRREAHKAARSRPSPAPIIVSDLDSQAVRVTKANAMTAGVDHLFEYHVGDFAATPLPALPTGEMDDDPETAPSLRKPRGIIVMNPEYGRRLGEEAQLKATYARIGDFLKQRCAGWTGFVFTGNLGLAKHIGLKASRRMPFWNAEIECRLLRYELYKGTRKATRAAADGRAGPQPRVY